jgi:hypothetical protein
MAALVQRHVILGAFNQEHELFMKHLAEQQLAPMAGLGTSLKTSSEGMTSTRGVGEPIQFNGDEKKYREWIAKLVAYIKATNPVAINWLDWARAHNEPVDDELFEVILCIGLEAYRLLKRPSEPETLRAKKALLKSIPQPPPPPPPPLPLSAKLWLPALFFVRFWDHVPAWFRLGSGLAWPRRVRGCAGLGDNINISLDRTK